MAKKTISITLYMSELLYDIENNTWLTGRSRSDGNNHELVAAMQANSDPEERNKIIREIGNSFASLKALLGEYVSANDNSASNAQISDSTNLTVSLSMPGNYNAANNDAVTTAMHEYIVANTLGRWFNITDKADSAEYIAMASAAIDKLKMALNRRVPPTRTAIP